MKLIFELVVKDSAVEQKLSILRANLRDIHKELRQVDEDSTAFKSLTDEAAKTKLEIIKLTEEQKNLKKEFAAASVPSDSLAGLRLEYSKLTAEITKLSKAERESEAGKALIKNAAAIKGEINEIQESVGNFTGNVGNYKNSILSASDALGSFGGSLGAQTGILQSAVAVFDAGSAGAKRFFDTAKEGAASFRENVGQFREYLSSLRETKKANTEAAESTEAVGDAVESVATGGENAGKGLTESARGAGVFARAGTLLKTVLQGLGIGLIISLIVGLISVFQRFAPIVDFVEQTVAGLSAAFDVFVSRVAKVATAFGKFFTGDFSGAFNDIGDAVSGVGSAMVDAAFAAAQLKKEMQDLEDAQKDFELTTARNEAAVARLSVALKDKTRSDSERLKIADEITKIESANLAEKTALIDKEIEIEKRRLLLNGQLTQQQVDQIAAGNFALARELEDQFLLQQDQADRIRELLIARTKAEGESATLLERVENRRSAILDAAAERQKAAREKQKAAAEKAARDLEAQIKRINELQNSIRDLDAATITNDFDRQSVEIENKRAASLQKVTEARDALVKKIAEQKGKLSEADQRELDLISEQTASINAAYDLQQQTVTRNREQAVADQLRDLAELSAEVQNIASQNAAALARAEAEIVNTGFAEKQRELEAVLLERKRALTEQLEAGTISQKRFKDEYTRAVEDFNVGTLQLERDRAAAVTEINANLEKSRIEAARVALATRLQAIEAETAAEIEAARERAAAEGGDAGATVDALRLRAIEQRTAAEQEFNDAARAAADERTKNEAAAADAINAADQKVHDDKLARLEVEAAKRRELNQQLLDAAGTVAGAIFEIERNRIDQQKNEAIAALDTEFEARRTAAAGNADQLAKIDAEYQKRKEAIEKEAARKRKRNAIIEAVIQGALAVVKALPNLVLAALTAVATAAQIAVISSQNFALGGIAQFRKSGVFGGKRHAQGGTKGVFDDGTQIEVERDEVFVILNRRASNEIRKLSAFNAKHGGRRFADGGLLDFTPQFGSTLDGTSGGAVFVVAEFTDEQIDVLAGRIAERTGAETRKAVVAGLDDRNRTAERQSVMDANREV